MTQAPTIDQLMQEYESRNPGRTPAEYELVRVFLVKARTSVTVFQAEIKVQSEEAKAA